MRVDIRDVEAPDGAFWLCFYVNGELVSKRRHEAYQKDLELMRGVLDELGINCDVQNSQGDSVSSIFVDGLPPNVPQTLEKSQ